MVALNVLHKKYVCNNNGDKMNSKKIEIVQTMFTDDVPVVNTATLKQNGIHSRNITELVNSGFITRIKQGHYIWSQKESDTSDIVLAAKLIPNGVLCLYTALEHYGLSTINPTEIFMALPRGTVAPSLPSNLRVNVRQMIDKHFELGISETELNGVAVKIYDVEKTVCDCFKYDKEVEKSIALESLKIYISSGNCNVQKLLEYAKIMGKKKTILPYVEAML